MKKFIYLSTILALASVLFAPMTRASDVHSGAHPNNARIQNATHHFEYSVRDNALSELIVQLPDKISIKGIDVTNSLGEPLDARVSINDTMATIVFSEPVPPHTTISVSLRGVRTPGHAKIWQYHLFGKLIGIDQAIPLGFARIQTYY